MPKTNESDATKPAGIAPPRCLEAANANNGGETRSDPSLVFVGYARVSTVGQSLQRQLDELNAAGCQRTFSDLGRSGGTMARPELERAIDFLRPGDVLVVTALDRLGRSVRGTLELIDALEAEGIGLRVIQLGLDTRTPSGRLVLTVLLAVAQLERDYISERTRSGLAAAKRRGRVGGRPRALTPAQRRAILAMRQDGASISECARAFGVSERTINRAIGASVSATSGGPGD